MGEIYKKLALIQHDLKAPKNLYNTFGKYNYRNCESIFEAVKPLLTSTGTILIMNDFIQQIGERYYLVAEATLIDIESGESIKASAMARESMDKKGMDESQITGATSSYARKYALNGLFLLDDTKDADTDEYNRQTNQNSSRSNRSSEKTVGKISSVQLAELQALCKKAKRAENYISTQMGVATLADLPADQFAITKKGLEAIIQKQGGNQ